MNAKRGITAAVIAIFLAGFGAACSSTSAPVTHQPPVTFQPVAVHQAPTARELAAKMGGTNFHGFDQLPAGDPMMAFGMVSGGSFWIGNDKYGVNTFTTKEGRDAWIKMAKKLGCNPKWETETSVIYPSMTPGGKS